MMHFPKLGVMGCGLHLFTWGKAGFSVVCNLATAAEGRDCLPPKKHQYFKLCSFHVFHLFVKSTSVWPSFAELLLQKKEHQLSWSFEELTVDQFNISCKEIIFQGHSTVLVCCNLPLITLLTDALLTWGYIKRRHRAMVSFLLRWCTVFKESWPGGECLIQLNPIRMCTIFRAQIQWITLSMPHLWRKKSFTVHRDARTLEYRD